VNDWVTTAETLRRVSATLSGIVFLVDDSPENNDATAQNVRAYCYLNPNAKKPVSGLFNEYMRGWNPEVLEDFRFDNY
jgi:hypothetical protein